MPTITIDTAIHRGGYRADGLYIGYAVAVHLGDFLAGMFNDCLYAQLFV